MFVKTIKIKKKNLFFSFQIWYFRKWIITSMGQSKHMRVTRFNPLWVSGYTYWLLIKYAHDYMEIGCAQNWEFSSIFFWIDDETLPSKWLIYKSSAFLEWAVPRRRVLISFGWLYLHVYCTLFVKSVTAGINF